MLNDKRTAERERGPQASRFTPTRGSRPATEYAASAYGGTETSSNPRAGTAGRSRNARPTTPGARSMYTGQGSSHATSRNRGKGHDGPTDYERDMMRRQELIALQLAAQDQIKDTYNSGGMRAVNSVFGTRIMGVNLPAAFQKPIRKRGF